MLRLVSRAVIATAFATAALVGVPTAAQAANGCVSDPYNVHVLSSPVTVDVVPPHSNVVYDWARVCVGVPGGLAYQEYRVVVHPFGPFGPAACNAPDNYTGFGTGDVTSVAGFTVSGGFGVALSPEVCLNSGGYYTVSLPILICSNVCVSSGVGDTGVLVGTFGLAGAPAGTTGAGVQLYNTALVVNGTSIPIGPAVYAGAGVGSGGVAAPTGSPIVCGPLNLVCVPGSAGIYYNGGPFAALGLSVLGTIPVSVPGGARCVPLFTVAPAGPAC